MARLYLLALAGATLGAIADGLCVAAARGWHPRSLAVVAGLLWAGCGPIWIDMLRRSQGTFAEPAAAWSVVGTCFTVALTIATGGSLSRVQWAGFACIMCGAIVFAVGALPAIGGR